MSIKAPISKYKLNGFKLYFVICLVVAVILAYDGYLSKYEWSKRYDFYKEHVIENNGVPDGSMQLNRFGPIILIAGAIFFGIRFVIVKNKKVVAGDTGIIANNQNIAYDTIEKIDKTHFESKGYFVITYKNQQGDDSQLKLSDKTYDNLGAILDEVVAKIS